MSLKDIEKEVLECEKCQLCKTRINAVPGEGSEDADVMFIGEGPGKDEDIKGKPFVGAAGRVLSEMLDYIGYKREDVYIANVVKCRPPNNRDPLQDEVDSCWPYLERQIKSIKPKIIVTLGRHSMARFLKDLKISNVHGKAMRAKGVWQPRQVYLPLFHPAVALYDPRKKDVLFTDFSKIPILLKKLTPNNDAS